MAAGHFMMWKEYLESVYMFVLLAMRVSALVSATRFAFGDEVPRGRGCQQTDRLAVHPEAHPISRILRDGSLPPSGQPLPDL